MIEFFIGAVAGAAMGVLGYKIGLTKAKAYYEPIIDNHKETFRSFERTSSKIAEAADSRFSEVSSKLTGLAIKAEEFVSLGKVAPKERAAKKAELTALIEDARKVV